MKTLYVMCGISGSGKSTLSKRIASRHNTIRLSLDEMGYIRHHRLIPYITEALENGKSVCVDALYITSQCRTELLEAIKNIYCKTVLICMKTPLDVCIRRNRGREKPSPDIAVKHQYEQFETPTLGEGWDEIIYVKEDGSYEFDFTGD